MKIHTVATVLYKIYLQTMNSLAFRSGRIRSETASIEATTRSRVLITADAIGKYNSGTVFKSFCEQLRRFGPAALTPESDDPMQKLHLYEEKKTAASGKCSP